MQRGRGLVLPVLRTLAARQSPAEAAGSCNLSSLSSMMEGTSGSIIARAASSESFNLLPSWSCKGQALTHRKLGSASALEEQVTSGQVPYVDIETLIGDEKSCISERIRHIVQAEVPSLTRSAEHFFQPGVEGKRVRSSALLLVSSALSAGEMGDPDKCRELLKPDLRPYSEYPEEVRRKQQRIAEITEMIHVATLLHDDVLDDAETRRGLNSVNKMFGNKTAILAGDFLLAKASVALAALRNTEVLILMATVIENLVSGEMMQSRSSQEERMSLDYYYRKTFLKTASLIANSCKSAALLGNHEEEVAQLASDYGYHLGMAFQLVDDVLDFVGSSSSLGKPTFSDLKSGIATAPVLFASLEEPQLVDLTLRKFRYEGDVEMASRLVAKTSGVKKTMAVAESHAMKAIKAVDMFPTAESKYSEVCRDALRYLASSVTSRRT